MACALRVLPSNGKYLCLSHLGSMMSRSVVVSPLRISISHVHGNCPDEQMCRVAARRVVASVTDLFSRLKRYPVFQFIGDAVSNTLVSSLQRDQPIAILVTRCCPQPATFPVLGTRYLRPEPICNRRLSRRVRTEARTPSPLVVLVPHRTGCRFKGFSAPLTGFHTTHSSIYHDTLVPCKRSMVNSNAGKEEQSCLSR